MRPLRTLGLSILFLLVAASSAGAQLPLEENDGVRIFRERGALVVEFTPRAEKLRRRLAGRVIRVTCTELPPPDDSGFVSINTGGAAYRVPRRSRTLRTGDRTRGLDYCRLSRVRPQRGRKRILSVPLTQRGAVYLDEEEKAAKVFSIILFASLAAEEAGGYPTYANLLDFASRQPGSALTEDIARELVPLVGPDDTPAAGAVGYYSDGGEHVAAVTLSRSGRRLFLEYEPGRILRTSVAGFIFGGLDD